MEYEKYIPEEEKHNESSPKRLILAIESMLKLSVGKTEINGLDHLKEIPEDRKVVVATTHLTDLDIPITIGALGRNLDMVIVDESVHHELGTEPSTYLGLKIAGQDNFIPVDYKKEGGINKPTAFNVENFEPMKEALEKGKRVVIAAHKPSKNHQYTSPGYAAAYLAEMENALILPVAVDVKSDTAGMHENVTATLLDKPDVDVFVGSPFELPKIANIEQMDAILKKRKNGDKLSREEIEEFSAAKKSLEQTANIILDRLKEMVPERDTEKHSN